MGDLLGRQTLAEQEDELRVDRLDRHVASADRAGLGQRVAGLVMPQQHIGLRALGGDHQRHSGRNRVADDRGQARLFQVFDSHQSAGHKEARINRELITEIARGVIKEIGYDQVGFSFHGADVEVLLHGQSPDNAMGVDEKQGQEGAGDQGMMLGFACTDSEAY